MLPTRRTGFSSWGGRAAGRLVAVLGDAGGAAWGSGAAPAVFLSLFMSVMAFFLLCVLPAKVQLAGQLLKGLERVVGGVLFFLLGAAHQPRAQGDQGQADQDGGHLVHDVVDHPDDPVVFTV